MVVKWCKGVKAQHELHEPIISGYLCSPKLIEHAAATQSESGWEWLELVLKEGILLDLCWPFLAMRGSREWSSPCDGKISNRDRLFTILSVCYWILSMFIHVLWPILKVAMSAEPWCFGGRPSKLFSYHTCIQRNIISQFLRYIPINSQIVKSISK